ncbi:DUF6716 putative glycosyltransferase [Streptomyces sp. NPDC006324]|uniref:DUF6716 putative glycosyltransferase n=1 Tax=Streptomyces sp. NPDC006324 TaxID=3156751 RepID=UPI0033BE9E87
MPSRTREAIRVAVLADSDTRWKWGALTARRITATSAEPTGFVLRGRATPTARQLAETGVSADAPREVTGVEFLRAVRDAEARGEGYDVLVLALVGGTVRAVLQGLADLGLARRPVIVTGYVGVVYEKLTDGLLLRHGADVVLANSRHDAERFRAVYEGVGAGAGSVVEAALPFLGGAPYAPAAGRDTLVFAAQPSVPATRAERAHVLRRLIGHARLHPGREVLLKLRSKPGEHTTHLEEFPFQKLVRELDPPDNFRLVYGHMGEVLDRTDLLVTVSSTAALEALHRRIPTAPDAILRKMAGIPLGLARAALDHVRELAKDRTDRETGLPWPDDHRVQETVAGLEAEFLAARSAVYATLERQWDALDDRVERAADERVETALARYHAFRTARHVVQTLFDLVGGASVYRKKSPMDRWLRDANTMNQHAVAQSSILQLTGNVLLGGRSTSPFF